MVFTGKTFKKMSEQVEKLLVDYEDEINKAYPETDNDMTINCSIKLSPSKIDGVKIVTSMSFSKGKISDKIELDSYNEQQMNIPGIDN